MKAKRPIPWSSEYFFSRQRTWYRRIEEFGNANICKEYRTLVNIQNSKPEPTKSGKRTARPLNLHRLMQSLVRLIDDIVKLPCQAWCEWAGKMCRAASVPWWAWRRLPSWAKIAQPPLSSSSSAICPLRVAEQLVLMTLRSPRTPIRDAEWAMRQKLSPPWISASMSISCRHQIHPTMTVSFLPSLLSRLCYRFLLRRRRRTRRSNVLD